MMEWPNHFLFVVLCLGVVAIFVPWLIPGGRRIFLFGLIPALAATGCWVAYEMHLHSIARAGDPLIRIDLFLIVPLIVLAWVSSLGSIAVKGLQASKGEPDAAPDPPAK
ncbi:MAG: hypothetical protein KY475_18135 [Planctomycetes bacterium]|nr:hypothetical protein [Planctomycetota bacterium]